MPKELNNYKRSNKRLERRKGKIKRKNKIKSKIIKDKKQRKK
jgi:hypothetical protein